MADAPEVPTTPAPRYATAAYWWVATELVHRHPTLELFESYIQGGFYDMLSLRGLTPAGPVEIDFNRHGSIHIHPGHIGFLSAGHVIANQDPHWAVKRIEEVAGLALPHKAPASSARVVVLRLMARTLNYLLNDQSSWDIRAISEHGTGPSVALLPRELQEQDIPFPDLFSTTRDFHAFMIQSDLPQQLKPGRLWALQRDSKVVAIFDSRGAVHTADGRLDLMPLYKRMNRNLTQVLAVALGNLLP